MKKVAFISYAFVCVALFLVIRLLGGKEDDWICQSGVWVKHGNPSAPKPTGSCGPAIVQKTKGQLEDASVCYSPNGAKMNFEIAKENAIAGCKDGKLKENHFCNSSTGTWWIDFTPNSPKEGCNPACVINVDTGEVEINWRCTGLREPSV